MEWPPSPSAPPLASAAHESFRPGTREFFQPPPVPDFIAAQIARLAKTVLSDRARYEKQHSDRAEQVRRSLDRGPEDGQYQWVPVSEHAGADGHSRLSLSDAAGPQGIRRATTTAYQPRSRNGNTHVARQLLRSRPPPRRSGRGSIVPDPFTELQGQYYQGFTADSSYAESLPTPTGMDVDSYQHPQHWGNPHPNAFPHD